MYKYCPIIVIIIGIAVLVTGIVCAFYGFPTLIESSVEQEIRLENGTEVFKIWEKQSLSFKVYIFNVTNPTDVMKGAVPILEEIGPYVYDLKIEREVINIDDDADSIEYYLTKRFYFNSTTSGCQKESDMVTVINAPLMGMVLKIAKVAPQMLEFVNNSYYYMHPGATDIFLRTQVKDLLFNGITVCCSAEEIRIICSAMKFGLPATMKPAKNNKDFLFSMFGKLNESSFGPFVMTRGIKNTTRGSLISYNGDYHLDYWPGDSCNMLNGSDSAVYSTMTEPVNKIYTFVPEICRSIGVTFEKKLTERNFVTYKYSTKEESLSHDGSHKCFCEERMSKYRCPLDVLQELDSCLRAPILISHPHFYLANKTLLNYTKGLNPQKDLHESFMILEPNTATPIRGYKRTQMNVELKKIEAFPLSQDVMEGIFPILWLEEGLSLPDNLLSRLEECFDGIIMLDTIKVLLIACGTALIFFAFILFMYQKRWVCFASTGILPINDPKHGLSHVKNINGLSITYSQGEDPVF